MRNFKLLEHRCVDEIPDLNGVHCMTVDNDAGIVYAATDQCIIAFDPLTNEIVSIVSLHDKGYLTEDGDRIIRLQYLADEQSVCVATSNGNVLLWHSQQDELECMGFVDSGLTAMEWSPDLELIILLTGQESIIMMTREFDPIIEKSMHPEDFGEAAFINVGWGKKETQFHGSEGKGAAVKKIEEIKVAHWWDDKLPRISWRGDGQFFTISNICKHTGARKIRIWSRECTHQSTSEDVNGCESALSWKPSGSLIASSQRKPNKHDVIFFEKNGLRHGEFTLPFGVNDVRVKEMYWNSDSTILCIWLEDLQPEGATDTDFLPKSYVQLWTVNNYHWYLKQTLVFHATSESVVAALMWDPEHVFRLHIMCKGGRYLQYTWCWVTNHSEGTTEDDDVIVAVIDGDKVLMTPLRRLVVPPPLSAYNLHLPCPVNQVIFAPYPNTNDIALLLADGRVAVYKSSKDSSNIKSDDVKTVAAGGNGFSVKCAAHQNAGIVSFNFLKQSGSPLALYHFLWIEERTFLCCGFDGVKKKSVIYKLMISDSDEKQSFCSKQLEVDGIVFSMKSSHDSATVAIQLNNGIILRYNPDNDTLHPWKTSIGRELSLPFPCTQMEICEIGGEEVILGLTERYRFYVNDIEVASNCTSFAVHNDFLLLSTLSHTCRCICRKTKIEVLPTLSDGKAHPFDESIRRIERGSRIVAVVPDDIKLILQMPRGNLETIHPRGLILSVVRKYLDKLQYNAAFTVMKKHRINMNLIHDHDPDLFLNNIQKFVEEVDSVNHFNIFLTDLQEDDVTITMYTAAYNRSKLEIPEEEKSKVDTICDGMRQALCKVNKNKYLLSVLTTHVRKATPELDTALQIVKGLRDNNEATEYVNAEEALKYLLFLVDVNELYDVALGTYDFDLVMMVAEKSQKDPKEYIPFLNGLRKLEENYQKFTIDKYLKRYKSALVHISKCGNQHFDEFMLLMKEHRLYTDALALFPHTSTEYKEIAVSFGNYLLEKKKYEESGLMFIKACDWSKALSAFEKCLNWRQIFCMTTKLGYSQEEVCETGRSIAVDLRSHHRYAEAATVYEQYAKDNEEAIVTLIEGSQWEESLRLMSKYNRTDFIETHLITSLDDSFDHIMAKLAQQKEDFEKYKKRLRVVREEKEKARLEFFESGGNRNEADADLFSDTSSATGDSVNTSRYSVDSQRSTYSKTSGMSRKSQRKAKQKKYKLKEGSAYEDVALVAALADIMKHIDGLKEDVCGLLKMLIQFSRDSKAETIQDRYEKLLKLIDKSITEIWCDDENTTALKPILGPDTTANSIAQAMRQGTAPDSAEEKDPILKAPPQMRKEVKWSLSITEMKGS